WNRVGYLRAVWQLRQALEPGVGPLEIAAGGEWTEKKETDLPRLAVGRHTTEVGPRAPQEIEALVLGTPIGGTEGALVVHDSFLGVYPETFALFGPGARVVNVNRVTSDDLMNVMLPLPRLLVLSSVERLSVRRMSQEWAFDGPLLQPLKEAYLEASRRACSDAQAVTVTEANGVTTPTGGSAYLVELPEGAACMALDLPVPVAELWRVWWPPLAGQEVAESFQPGRWFTLAASNTPLLLPAGVAGQAVLVEPLPAAPAARDASE